MGSASIGLISIDLDLIKNTTTDRTFMYDHYYRTQKESTMVMSSKVKCPTFSRSQSRPNTNSDPHDIGTN